MPKPTKPTPDPRTPVPRQRAIQDLPFFICADCGRAFPENKPKYFGAWVCDACYDRRVREYETKG